MANQTHIFATRSDLVPGLQRFESEREVRYARCDLYHGPIYEHCLSLLEWSELGKNPTGDHVSEPRFLIAPRQCEINVEPAPQAGPGGAAVANREAWVVDSAGGLSKASLNQCLSGLEAARDSGRVDARIRYNVSQKLNLNSMTFSPGGIYNNERVLVCGHIGTVSTSAVAQGLYRTFVKAVTRGFKKFGSYRVGPEAARLMDEGYRIVTIGVSSPSTYDLRRS